MEKIYYNLGEKKFSIHEIACLNIVLRESDDNKYTLPEKHENWMRLCLDMLVLEGILEREIIGSKPTDSWFFTEYGEEFTAIEQIKADINLFAEVAVMGDLYSRKMYN